MSTESVGRINDTADVVIVGAGLAGLTAARTFSCRGRADRRDTGQAAGGRAWTKRDALTGHSFEMGGMFVDAGQRVISAALREYGLTTTPGARRQQHRLDQRRAAQRTAARAQR
ncbi:FAD-dependent oxidoreductase [Mycobacterium simiae]|nr:FAD-dependent oxidoreductase [Mycobacterium simiae]